MRNFAVLQYAVVTCKMQWFGLQQLRLPEISPVFSAAKELLTFAMQLHMHKLRRPLDRRRA
jgi:hypothetical protein